MTRAGFPTTCRPSRRWSAARSRRRRPGRGPQLRDPQERPRYDDVLSRQGARSSTTSVVACSREDLGDQIQHFIDDVDRLRRRCDCPGHERRVGPRDALTALRGVFRSRSRSTRFSERSAASTCRHVIMPARGGPSDAHAVHRSARRCSARRTCVSSSVASSWSDLDQVA